LLVVAGGPRRASADEGVVPPRAAWTPRVPYPDGAHGSATVVLDLVLGRTGEVEDVLVVGGDEPFVTAAVNAARSWRFEPAHRGDLAVSARVRVRVDFTEPPPPELTTAPGPPLAPSPSSAEPATAPVEEVNVHGARREAGGTTLEGGEVRQIPGAFGDAFRAIEALPGVTPIVSGLPYFFVRGAPPGNTGYFIDGVRVPLLYHLAFGPSVIHPALVDRVDFYPGGYPARFGRFAGGIVEGETRAPASELHGEYNVRLFDAGALVESPFADGRGTALVAGRYGYPGPLVSLFAKDTRLSYWDYQTRATLRVGEHDEIGVFAFGSYDYLGQIQTDGSEQQLFATEFHRIDLRYDRGLGGDGQMRLAATFGFDRTGDDTGDVLDLYAALRLETQYRASSDVRVRGGADVAFDHYDLENSFDTQGATSQKDATLLYPPRNDVVMGAWSDAIVRVSPRVEIVPGVRADVFTSRLAKSQPPPELDPDSFLTQPYRPTSGTAIPAVDPRFSARVAVHPKATLVSTFGISHQPPAFFVPVPGLGFFGPLDSGLQTSIQTSQGVEIALPGDFTATPTLFLHNYLGLSDITATCLDAKGGVSTGDQCELGRVRGRAFGLELLVRRSLTKRLTGWVAYTLSRSTREAHPVDTPDRVQTILSEFDRTHVLNLIGAYDLGRGWRAGARFFYYSGLPYSDELHGVPIPPYNSERLPDFYRLDARLEKRWTWQTRWLSFVAEWMNATLNKEAVGTSCHSSLGELPPQRDTCVPNYIGPVTIPSVGIEGGF
jgi:TonB family protein